MPRTYISVILPLRLDWEPTYWTDLPDIRVGEKVLVRMSGRQYEGVVKEVGITPSTSPSRIMQIEGRVPGSQAAGQEELAFWEMLAEYYLCSLGEVYKAACPPGQKKERLRARKEAAGAIAEDAASPSGNGIAEVAAPADGGTSPVAGIRLTAAQQKAEEEILAGFADRLPVLLHGVTGSGKTELYIRQAAMTLATGKDVLYLVPEIALSRQLEDRLRECFPDNLLVYHSGESAATRRKGAWIVGQTGNPQADRQTGRIVLGTRSALFLPFRNLGLLIVDEEQDTSYKQDSPAPRYNGRESAVMLASCHKDCRILLGSATPSIESIYNCHSGKYRLVTLEERYFGSGEAGVELIDTRAERRKRGMVGTFSRKLIDAIQAAISQGGQVMILRTRKGYSPILQCPDCGYIPRCPRCNVSLTWHKAADRARCHHCGFSIRSPQSCPSCGSALKALGAGTQRIEEEAAALFPNARIARLDSDVTQSKKAEAQTIRDFDEGRIDILIGTQMLAKGFDFSNISIVAVIQADTLLGLQDFRADEKAWQLLCQFRGRCARRGQSGWLFIQTSIPEHPVYKALAGNGPAYEAGLLEERRIFHYPPYTRLIHVLVRDSYEDRAERMASRLSDQLRHVLGSTVQVSDPFAPMVSREKGRSTRIIRIILPKDKTLKSRKASLKEAISGFESGEKYSGHITLDVDPA